MSPHAAIRAAAVALAVSLSLAAAPAHAALATGKCLGLKAKAWGAFRKCEAAEETKRVLGKTAKLDACATKRNEKLQKIDAKALKAAIACRFQNSGDGTVTDYDTGLQWERKTGRTIIGSPNFFCTGDLTHCVNDTVTWDQAQRRTAAFNGVSANGIATAGRFAGHGDWRLPTNVELSSLFDASAPGCGVAACIDPNFGLTLSQAYWSQTPKLGDDSLAVAVGFGSASFAFVGKNTAVAFRAVRSAL
jgi:hypothetical protein